MTAPAAPVIYVSSQGERALVRWRPVPTATDYKLYLQESGGARGLEDDIADDELASDGWMATWTRSLVGVVNFDVTALNVGAEESAASNVVQRSFRANHEVHPTDALRHTMKGAQSRP